MCFFYNEETLARLFVLHYHWADEILAIVSRSTDKTEEVLRNAPNVTCMHFEFPDGMDDVIKTDAVNQMITQRSQFDWIIVVDADEFIWPASPDGKNMLNRVPLDKNVLIARMRNVYRHVSDKDLDLTKPPVPQRIHGDPDYNSGHNHLYQKPIVIRANCNVELGLGNHTQRNGKVEQKMWFEGAHWQNADPSFAVKRRIQDRRDRQSKNNLINGLGDQNHNITENDILRLCQERRNCPVIFK